ncbi:UNVERIFIED_CONTAM: TetR family transcriptional regulator [Acetivibrio alkalicellulosi]
MNSAFESLSTSRRKHIIDVCIEEFSQNGYEKGSTNTIIKKAGISKGILFHYFGNKKKLYLYMVDYAIDIFLKEFYDCDDINKYDDVFDKLIAWGVRKIELYQMFPGMSKLVIDAFANTPEELKKDIMYRYSKIYDQSVPQFIKDIDTSKFKEGVDPTKAIELILICLNGMSEKYLKLLKVDSLETINMNEIFDEMKEYFEILKGGIYGYTT